MTCKSQRRSHPSLPTLMASAWLLVTALPAMAEPIFQQETPQPSITETFLKKPDIIAPLVVPMVGAFAVILVLGMFLAWVSSRLPSQ